MRWDGLNMKMAQLYPITKRSYMSYSKEMETLHRYKGWEYYTFGYFVWLEFKREVLYHLIEACVSKEMREHIMNGMIDLSQICLRLGITNVISYQNKCAKQISKKLISRSIRKMKLFEEKKFKNQVEELKTQVVPIVRKLIPISNHEWITSIWFMHFIIRL